ncbi:GNAT family protein [Erysipelotrichia bacterium]
MAKKTLTPSLIEMLAKPAEIFAGIMPPGRQLFAARIFLRHCHKLDAPELMSLYRKNRIFLNTWLQPQPEMLRIENFQKMIAEEHRMARRGERLDLGIFNIADNALIGRVALHSVDYGIQRSAGLSYWLDEAHTGKGLIREALATLVSFAFEEACLHRVWLNISVENQPSLAVARRLGFKKEGTLRQSLFINGAWRDSQLFSLLEDDYDSLADIWIKNRFLGA